MVKLHTMSCSFNVSACIYVVHNQITTKRIVQQLTVEIKTELTNNDFIFTLPKLNLILQLFVL